MNLALLRDVLAERGEPAYRARQVWEWAARGAASYDEMTNVPAALRVELAERIPFSTLTVERETTSRDGTVKVLFRTHDGHPVEAVLMRYQPRAGTHGRPRSARFAGGSQAASSNSWAKRATVCVSSQSGCPLTCTFCATGSMAFGRNLTASEIVDQALHFRRIEADDDTSGSRQAAPEAGAARREGPPAGGLTHCVFMGMGEPMLNLDAVLEAARLLPGVGITHRRTTVSTVGWMPGLARFVDEVEEPIRLALSLHAPDDALRSHLMPVNERYALAEVLDACRHYAALRGRRVFVEYVMLAGVNDRVEQAAQLARLLTPREAFKVNLIPYNPTGQGNEGSTYISSSPKAIAAFRDALVRVGLPATVRLTRGRDIAAACGQLAAAPRAREAAAASGT